eukprot:scaffold15339_cov27-Phaeocystis_antarctica.AAC.1
MGLGGYEELRPPRRGERGSASVLRSVLRLDGATAEGATPSVGAAGTTAAGAVAGLVPSPSAGQPLAVPRVAAGGAGGAAGVARAAPSGLLRNISSSAATWVRARARVRARVR